MAHASRGQKAKLQLKNIKKTKANQKYLDNQLKRKIGEEEFDELKKKQHTISLKTSTTSIIWDYKHQQLSRTKRKWALEILNKRLQQINNKKEIQEIEVIINGIKR